jgi:hypothetical protein
MGAGLSASANIKMVLHKGMRHGIVGNCGYLHVCLPLTILILIMVGSILFALPEGTTI